MAISTAANSTPPAFLLFEFVLASSWTWFALLLATIATTLRALRLRFPRSLASEAASTPAISFLPDTSKTRTCPSFPASLQHSFKRRAGSKSTSALEKLLHRNGGNFWRSGIEVLSSVLDVEPSSNLKRIASASKVFHGQNGCAKMHQRPGPWATVDSDKTTRVSSEKKQLHSAKQVVDSGNVSGILGQGLKFQWEIRAEEIGDACIRSSMAEDQDCANDCALWLPTWAHSLCAPSQLKWPSMPHAGENVLPDLMASSCFEKQFGWDKVLDNKLGFPWRLPSGTVSEPYIKSRNVVRMWKDLPQKLIRRLDLDESSTLALDTYFQEGLACTGDFAGKLSMWELDQRECLRDSAAFAEPVLATTMNFEQCTTVVGSATSIGLWDQRSASLSNVNFTGMPSVPLYGLKSRGNGLCIASDDGIVSMYDLRKLCGGPILSGIAPKRQLNLATSDYDCTFWEKFAGVAEQEDEADCDFAMEVQEDGSNTCSSLMSRLTTSFVRAVTFML
ncbi:hypothetical protein GOP47_0015198 [Adiantum capillus-veneris]|uniref:Uncharacterized protein n=1 Tax=Adiantum capillus-veneris TaxID=13818 RepID=A0A9D4ZEZ5_ADICA|nr:hypothetical protein GOP47_0015198 [Adiantum capillus-veneris]